MQLKEACSGAATLLDKLNVGAARKADEKPNLGAAALAGSAVADTGSEEKAAFHLRIVSGAPRSWETLLTEAGRVKGGAARRLEPPG